MAGTVVFDLDDCVCNSRDLIQKAMFKRHGQDIPWTEWTNYELGRSYGLGPMAVMDAIVAEGILPHCAPEPGGIEALREVKLMGYQVVIATARGFYPDAEQVTRQWLDRHGVQPDHLVVTTHGQKKADVLRPFRDIHAYVDDNLGHLAAVHEAGLSRHLVVMDRPWNRKVDRFHRVHHIDEFVSFLRASEACQ